MPVVIGLDRAGPDELGICGPSLSELGLDVGPACEAWTQ